MEFQNYIKAYSLDEAIQQLQDLGNSALLLAGGTDVLVNAREGERYKDRTLVDIYGLPELCQISDMGDVILIGSGVSHSQIATSPLIRRYAPVLCDACETVGSLQIRNHATIGGNLGNASPAADSLAALAVLEAQVIVNRLGNERTLTLEELIDGPYRTTLTPQDIITGIAIKKLPSNAKTNFTKVGRRKALSISRMTIATVLVQDDQGMVEEFCMTMGATFPKPLAFPEINHLLIGKIPTMADVELVAEQLSNKIPEIAGIRPSTTYKQPVCRKLCQRILTKLLGGDVHDEH